MEVEPFALVTNGASGAGEAEFEPTLVSPFAAYFAESQGAPIIILPHNQFAIIKPLDPGDHFQILDCTQRYGERVLLRQIAKK